MDWNRWYIEGGNYTIYWFATGRKKPGFSEIVSRAFFNHRDEIRANIFAHNSLFQRMRGGVGVQSDDC